MLPTNAQPPAIVLPTTLEKKEQFFNRVKNQVLDGILNPLELYRQIKLLNDLTEELKKDPEIFDCVRDEVNKYGKEKPTINGSVVELKSRSTPDYESTGDPIWKELKAKISEREKFLKSIPSGGTVDPDTGQLLEPPTVKVSEYITVKL